MTGNAQAEHVKLTATMSPLQKNRALNDHFRKTAIGGIVSISWGIHMLDRAEVDNIMKRLGGTEGDTSCDVGSEHDGGEITVSNRRTYCEIDYYNKASGIGQATLLDAIAGLLSVANGSVTWGDNMPKHSVQKLYQDLPAAATNRPTLVRTLCNVARLHKPDWSYVMQFLDQLSVHPSLLEGLSEEVSGGELQRILIARALTVRPKVLLTDEPTSRLDPITQRQALSMLERIARDDCIAIVLVTHGQNIVQKLADREISLI